MSDAAYLVNDPAHTAPSLLFNSHEADEFKIIEPIADFVNFGFLDNFAVRKDYRSQGIAQVMLNYFEQDCRKHGKQLLILGVETENHTARRSYSKFGFKVHPVYSIAMVKKLD